MKQSQTMCEDSVRRQIQLLTKYCINKVIIIMDSSEGADDESKVQNIILELNKAGLSFLKFEDFAQAIEYFKKAEKLVVEELIINEHSAKINQLAAITYNNIACYYKKTKKPKVALSYLQKCLEIEIYKLKNWISIGSTHLNICAIYSYLKKHQEALLHVDLALQLLQKQTFEQNDSSEEAKTYWNIKMLCFYNKAIEQEHLKQLNKSLESYKHTKQLAKLSGAKNVGIILSCDEAITRIEADFTNRKKRMISIFLKKREDEQSGHYDYMRRNITREKKDKLKIKDFSTAQLIKQGKSIRLEKIVTTSNKQSQIDLYLSKNSSQNVKSRRDYYRNNTEQTETTNHY